jgi:Icc-related predicted phosphoesterase
MHVFGHIHEAAGVVRDGDTLFVNASTDMGQGAATVVHRTADGVEVNPPAGPW